MRWEGSVASWGIRIGRRKPYRPRAPTTWPTTCYGEYTILKPNPNYPGPAPTSVRRDRASARDRKIRPLRWGRWRASPWTGIAYVFEPTPHADRSGFPAVRRERARDVALVRRYPLPVDRLLRVQCWPAGIRRSGRAPRGSTRARSDKYRRSVGDHTPTDQFLPPLPARVRRSRPVRAGQSPTVEKARELMRGRYRCLW